MLTSLTLTNFRGFTKLEIPRLARVNLIGGVNNAGKTTILEAIYLLLERNNQKLDGLPSIFRAPSSLGSVRYFWNWLSKQRNLEAVIRISARDDSGRSDEVLIVNASLPLQEEAWLYTSVAGRGFAAKSPDSLQKGSLATVSAFSPRPTDPIDDARVYTEALTVSLENEERIEALLRELDGRIKRVRPLADPETKNPVLHVGLDSGETLPATQLGQGFNRLLRIYSALFAAEANVFLIDEIETGLHHSVLPTIWKGLAAVARQEGVQIFATTHSREAILAAHRVFSDEPDYDFAYHRLERDAKGEVCAVTYDQEALTGADEANFEVR